MEYLLYMLNVSTEREQKTHLIFMLLRQTVDGLHDCPSHYQSKAVRVKMLDPAV